MRVGYGKIGRALGLPPASWGEIGGDNEPPILLNKLARRNPEHTFVLMGRNSGENPTDIGLPANVENPWPAMADEFRSWTKGNATPMTQEQLIRTDQGLRELLRPQYEALDGVVLWVGQHGTSNSIIPKVKTQDGVTKPQDSFVYYAGYHVRGVNAWREPDPQGRKEVWLVPDVRNYLKCRDLKNPPGHILSQYDFIKKEKHYRYGDHSEPVGDAVWSDEGLWKAPHHYEYAQLEISGIPSSLELSLDWEGRRHFGLVINEARHYGVQNPRLLCMLEYVMPLQPAWVRGKWTADSEELLGIGHVESVAWHAQWDLLRSVRSTFTTPSSGSGWATTKPWEAFAVGTVCFFHPAYDDQGHIIPTLADVNNPNLWSGDEDLAHLVRWLRVESPEQLAKRVAVLDQDRDTWTWLVTQQRRLFDAAMTDARCMREIEARCGLTT